MMETRRLYAQPDQIIEILEPSGLSALRVRVLTGSHGNTQVLIYSQPGCMAHLDPPQSTIPYILAEDPHPDLWRTSFSEEYEPNSQLELDL